MTDFLNGVTDFLIASPAVTVGIFLCAILAYVGIELMEDEENKK